MTIATSGVELKYHVKTVRPVSNLFLRECWTRLVRRDDILEVANV
jgi:hypothetical protein